MYLLNCPKVDYGRTAHHGPPRVSHGARKHPLHLTAAALLILVFPGLTLAKDTEPLAHQHAAEESLLLEKPDLCFTPDTPDAYVAAKTQMYARSADPLFQDSVLQDDSSGVFYKAQTLTRWSQTATDGSGLGMGDATVLTWSYVPDGTMIQSHARRGSLWQQPAILAEQPVPAAASRPGTSSSSRSSIAGLRSVASATSTSPTMTARPSPAHRASSEFVEMCASEPIASTATAASSATTSTPAPGEMVIDSTDGWLENQELDSLRLRNLVAHEHGHGLGLGHVCPVDRTKLMEPYATTEIDGPQMDEILGVQRLYGDPARAW